MHKMHMYGQEACSSCGAANRWWVSRKGYDSQEYAIWVETGLCPKCAPVENMTEIKVICAWCNTDLKVMFTINSNYTESHGICMTCKTKMEASYA